MYINGIAGEGQIVWGKMKEGRGERGEGRGGSKPRLGKFLPREDPGQDLGLTVEVVEQGEADNDENHDDSKGIGITVAAFFVLFDFVLFCKHIVKFFRVGGAGGLSVLPPWMLRDRRLHENHHVLHDYVQRLLVDPNIRHEHQIHKVLPKS